MGRLTILRAGVQSQIQDLGRAGLAYYAIAASGPLDRRSAGLANALLGNDPQEAVIECHFSPPKIRFDSAATVCFTGAAMHWRVDGQRVDRYRTCHVPPGGVIDGRAATIGCRGYIGIRGTIQTERTFGSAACDTAAAFGGNGGRVLSAGDQIEWLDRASSVADIEIEFPDESLFSDRVAMNPGPEFGWLSEDSRERLRAEKFWISDQCNRMGAKLAGPELSTGGRSLADSVAVFPGVVQLPPSGHPIVVLADGQTTGGYPRIGYVPAADLSSFSQLPPKFNFQFDIENPTR